MPADAAAVADLAVDSELFSLDDVGVVEAMLAAYFAHQVDDGHACVVAEDDAGEPVGVAYYEPAKATDGTWYLTMIAVRRAHQGRGQGSALMAHVEEALRGRCQRVLLVETSGAPAFERTRAFYRGLGYEVEAQVRDFYAAGDDMVLFRKALSAG